MNEIYKLLFNNNVAKILSDNYYLITHIGVALTVLYFVSDSKFFPNKWKLNISNPIIKFLIFYLFVLNLKLDPYISIFISITLLLIFEILNIVFSSNIENMNNIKDQKKNNL